MNCRLVKDEGTFPAGRPPSFDIYARMMKSIVTYNHMGYVFINTIKCFSLIYR